MGQLMYGLAYKTALPISEIEDWLDGNCEGTWEVSLGGLDDSDPLHLKKKLKMYFELESDIRIFKA